MDAEHGRDQRERAARRRPGLHRPERRGRAGGRRGHRRGLRARRLRRPEREHAPRRHLGPDRHRDAARAGSATAPSGPARRSTPTPAPRPTRAATARTCWARSAATGARRATASRPYRTPAWPPRPTWSWSRPPRTRPTILDGVNYIFQRATALGKNVRREPVAGLAVRPARRLERLRERPGRAVGAGAHRLEVRGQRPRLEHARARLRAAREGQHQADRRRRDEQRPDAGDRRLLQLAQPDQRHAALAGEQDHRPDRLRQLQQGATRATRPG